MYLNRTLENFWMKISGKYPVLLLTGSQEFQLMKGVSESLAGRVGIVNILGLSQRELVQKSSDDVPFLPEASILEERMKEQPAWV